MATNTIPVRADATVAKPAKMLFPFLDLGAQFATIRDEVMAAVQRVFETQHFIMGPDVEKLEKEIAPYVGCDFVFGCASGSDALLLALMALGIAPGDEVITTPFTFGATAGSIARLQARPVFVDIDPETYNLDPEQVAAAVTPRTRAIMPVHLFGLAAEMDPICATAKRHNLAVVEDAAQAIGAKYSGRAIGSIGTIGCFSFFPSKNLGCAGDGGLVTTNDAGLAERLKILRMHGCRKKYQYDLIGTNSRLDALQAAILRVKLPHLATWTQGRQRNAERYRKLFAEFGIENRVVLPFVPAGRVHVYNQFVIRAPQRDELRSFLQQHGIPTEIYYPRPLHTELAYAPLGYKPGAFPETEKACREVVALPIYPELTEAMQRETVAAIADFYQPSDGQ